MLDEFKQSITKNTKMVLSNTASPKRKAISKDNMKLWVKSSPFFGKKNEESCR